MTELKQDNTPEARAARLKRLRNMANLSRYEMCNSESLNINTYKGWEIARYGGLPNHAAEKVIRRLAKAGVICSKAWLLLGTGQEPYVLPTLSDQEIVCSDEELIIKEVSTFAALYTDTVYAKITDDTLLPYYALGDYVAGIRKYKSEINTALHQRCIIMTTTGELLVRYLKQGSKDDLYSLYCINIETTTTHPVCYDVSLEYAAPIIRHYTL